MLNRLSLFACSLILFSCANKKNNVDVTKLYPKNYAYQEESEKALIQINNAWWKEFALPQVIGLIEDLLDKNYDIQEAEFRIEQARAAHQMSWKGRLPTLSYFYRGTTYGDDSEDILSAGARQSVYRQELLANYQIDLFGKYRDNEKSYAEMVIASRYNKEALEHRKISSLLQLAIVWDKWYEERQIVEENLKSARRRSGLIEQRYMTLEGSGSNIALVKAEIVGYEGDYLNINKMMLSTQLAIENLLVMKPNSLTLEYPLMRDQTELFINLLQPLDLIERRPDLKARAHLLKSKRLDVSIAFKNFFPDMEIGVSGEMIAGSFPDLFKSGSFALRYITRLFQYVFSGMDLTGRWRLATAKEQEEAVGYAKNALIALFEVETALMQIHYYTKMREKKALEVREITDVQNYFLLDYKVGDGPLIFAIEQERVKWRAQQQLVNLDALLFSEKINLCLALGGSWNNEKKN